MCHLFRFGKEPSKNVRSKNVWLNNPTWIRPKLGKLDPSSSWKIFPNLKFSDLISESKLCQNLICHKSDIEIFSVGGSHNTNLPRDGKFQPR